MYKVNDTVIYGTKGVCKIIEISEREFLGKSKEYYILKPINNTSTTFFAPTDNQAVLDKMHRIISKQEIEELVDATSKEEPVWIQNDNERRERFREILLGGKHHELIQMIKVIWIQKQKREAEGKKLHISDERFFKDAEELLYAEFQYVLEINKEELVSFIFKTK